MTKPTVRITENGVKVKWKYIEEEGRFKLWLTENGKCVGVAFLRYNDMDKLSKCLKLAKDSHLCMYPRKRDLYRSIQRTEANILDVTFNGMSSPGSILWQKSNEEKLERLKEKLFNYDNDRY